MAPSNKKNGYHYQAEVARLQEELRKTREMLAQTQASLQEKNTEIAAFMDAVPAPVWFTDDPESRRIEGNQAMYELLGAPRGVNVSKTAPSGIEIPPYQILSDGVEVPADQLPVQMAARGKEIHDYAFDLKSQDGRLHHMYGNAKPLPKGAVGVFLDVTELRNVQEALRESEARLRTLVECSPIGLLMGTEKGQITYANPTLLGWLGYDPKDAAAGLRWDVLTPPEYLAQDYQVIQELKSQGTCAPYEKNYIRKDGRLLPVRLGVAAIGQNPHDGLVMVAYVLNLSEEKAAQEALWENQKRLSMAQEVGKIGVFDWDLVRHEVVLNDPGGFGRSRCLRAEDWSKEVSREERERLESLYADWFKSGQPEIDYEVSTPDGRWYNARARIIRDHEGKPIRVMGIKQDITGRKLGQERLKKLNELLEIRVGEGAAELASKVIELQMQIQERKRAEEALNEQKILLESIFAQTVDAIVVIDARGELLLTNAAARKFISNRHGNGRPIWPEDWGRLSDEMGLFIPEDQWPTEQALKGTVTAGRFFTLERPDGTRTDVLLSSGPLKKADGTILGATAAFADVTALKKAERDREGLNRELQRKVTEFQILLNAAPVGIAVAQEPDCRHIVMNPSLARILGLPMDGNASLTPPPGEPLPTHRYFRNGLLVEGRDLPMQRAGTTGQEVIDDLEVRRADNTRLNLIVHAVPLQDEQHRIRGALATFMDITEFRRMEGELRQDSEELEIRVRSRTEELSRLNQALGRENQERRETEAALRRSEERFRRLVEGGGFGLVIGDQYGHVDYMNPALLHMLGYKEEEIKSGTVRWDKITPPEYAALDMKAVTSLETTGRVAPYEKVYLAKEGRRIPVVIGGTVLERKPDGRHMVAAYVLDMSQLRQAEAALRESEARLTLAQKAGQVGVFDWDLSTNRTIWTEQLEDIFGIPHGSFGGHYDDWSKRVDPRDLPWLEAYFQEWIRSNRADGEWEYRIIRPSGEMRWIAARAHLLRDGLGMAVRMIGTNMDTTERKRYEENLRKEIVERRQIEENLRLSKELLRQKTEALTEADRRKNEFLAMLAHELRNPLSPIRTTLALIRAQVRDKNGRMGKRLEVMERQVSHLARIVDDLLDTSRISRGMIELKKERVNLVDAVRQAVENNRQMIDHQRQELTLELPPKPVWLMADSVRLTQIFSNLLNNASKYTPPGGKISARARTYKGNALVTVADNGIGIDSQVLPHIFELFYQADKSLDRAKGGLGLGLTLVKNLTQQHGGSIEAGSKGAGQGSTFTVRLPLADQPTESWEQPKTEAQVPEGHPLKILIVEDNVDSAESLGEVLQYWGHQIWLSHDGADALRKAGQVHPDVALLDIGLPGMDGYELGKQFHANPELSRTFLVALTGYDPRNDPERSGPAKFDRYFIKPVDLEALGDFLHRLVQPH